MPEITSPYPALLPRLARIRGLADHLDTAIAALSPGSDVAIPALCSVLFEIAASSPDPEFSRQAAQSLRIIAGLIEEHCP